MLVGICCRVNRESMLAIPCCSCAVAPKSLRIAVSVKPFIGSNRYWRTGLALFSAGVLQFRSAAFINEHIRAFGGILNAQKRSVSRIPLLVTGPASAASAVTALGE